MLELTRKQSSFKSAKMDEKSPKIFVAIPAFNEAVVIQEVIQEIQRAGYANIVIADDGSTDDTLDKAKAMPGIVAVRHKINRGKGAATKTAIEAAKLLNADIIVTLDGDGQHDPTDIEKLIAPIKNKECEVVLGTRLQNTTGMPWYKICANHFGNLVTWYLFGLYVTDSQSGFRAYSRHAAELINTTGDRYEFDSEVIREIAIHKLKFQEVPIKVRYTAHSMGKVQKQGVINGIITLYRMILKLIF